MNNQPPPELAVYEVSIKLKQESLLSEYFIRNNIVRKIAWNSGAVICYDAYLSDEDCVSLKLTVSGVSIRTPEEDPGEF